MENNNNSRTGDIGMGFCSMLTLVFIVLKLTHVIDWSWFWVLSPSIFGVLISLLIILAIILSIRK